MGINKNFVIRNGIQVGNNLIFASDDIKRVGINTSLPTKTFEVKGDLKVTDKIYDNNDQSGIVNQVLQSTGDGYIWASLPNARSTFRETLTNGQTNIPSSGTFPDFTITEESLVDVFLDGVRLTTNDYTVDSGGTFVTLNAPAFGDEEVEVIATSTVSVGSGNTGILGITIRESGINTATPGVVKILDFVGLGVTLSGNAGLVTVYVSSGGLSDVQSDLNPLLGGDLGLNSNDITGSGNISITGNLNVSGIATASEFHGDGSNLTGITTLISAGDNITITTFGGITTITSSNSGNSGGTGFFSDDQSNPGIHTTSSFIGLGTDDPNYQVEINSVGSSGTSLYVNGDVYTTTNLQVGSGVTIKSNGNATLSGIITATSFDGDLIGEHKVYTISSNNDDEYKIPILLNPTDLGHTYVRYDPTVGQLQYNPSTGKLINVGIISATSFEGDGSRLTGITTLIQAGTNITITTSNGISTINSTASGGSGTEVIIKDDDSLIGTAGTINFDSGLSVTPASAGVVTVTASTDIINDTSPQLGGNLDLNSNDITGTGDINITGDATLDNLRVSGVSTTDQLIVSGISSLTADTGTFTASAGVAYTANTYNASNFETAEYTLFFQHSSGIQSQKVLVMDDGTTAYSQEYGIMYSNDLLVSVGATIRSGNVELEWTPETGVNGIVTFKYSRDMLI